jgi:hypothetical protein
MPGSLTAPGRPGARAYTHPAVLPSSRRTASAPGFGVFEAQWLAYALPYRRFAAAHVDTLSDTLVDASARLGADADRYSFIVVDLHHLLLAGFSGARDNHFQHLLECISPHLCASSVCATVPAAMSWHQSAADNAS